MLSGIPPAVCESVIIGVHTSVKKLFPPLSIKRVVLETACTIISTKPGGLCFINHIDVVKFAAGMLYVLIGVLTN